MTESTCQQATTSSPSDDRDGGQGGQHGGDWPMSYPQERKGPMQTMKVNPTSAGTINPWESLPELGGPTTFRLAVGIMVAIHHKPCSWRRLSQLGLGGVRTCCHLKGNSKLPARRVGGSSRLEGRGPPALWQGCSVGQHPTKPLDGMPIPTGQNFLNKLQKQLQKLFYDRE